MTSSYPDVYEHLSGMDGGRPDRLVGALTSISLVLFHLCWTVAWRP